MSIPINRLDDLVWEIPREHDPRMRVPARVYADRELLTMMRRDRTLSQCIDMTHLPGILRYAITLPDGHQGYGFPIGGVAAFDAEEGVITPGGVGYDINCGVRLMRTDLTYEEVRPRVGELIDRIFSLVPCGVGVGSKIRLSTRELDNAIVEGVEWAIGRGYGWEGDSEHIEEGGRMEEANPDKISSRAKQRGSGQLGTLGAGNHFLEIARVREIHDEATAKTFGITGPDQIVVWIHTGSRGYGHQIASDYIRVMDRAVRSYGIRIPTRELGCAPLKSREAEDYYQAMSCAINWAFINRHVIMHKVRQAFEETFKRPAEEMGMNLVYGMTHNTAKREEHTVDGRRVRTVIHRKGASRAFGPGRKDLPDDYRSVGQPVLLVGTMGTASYLLVGTERGEEISFASTAHGAGRVMSRTGARRRFTAKGILSSLKRRGIVIRAASGRIVQEESPDSYKDIHRVADVSHRLGIGRKVMMSVPMAVAKG
ncbi:MAG: RtcB family protein [Candidatus Bathyarchaeota archaeon]|nr:RtcB family protein [Candidatus Bathyarchaeota archaeon]